MLPGWPRLCTFVVRAGDQCARSDHPRPSPKHVQMTSVLTLVGDLVLQSAAAAHDTVITKQVLAERGTLEQISTAASAVMTLALLLLTIVAIPVAWRLRNTYKKVDHLLERIHDDITPIMANAHEISDSVNYITT